MTTLYHAQGQRRPKKRPRSLGVLGAGRSTGGDHIHVRPHSDYARPPSRASGASIRPAGMIEPQETGMPSVPTGRGRYRSRFKSSMKARSRLSRSRRWATCARCCWGCLSRSN
jgi:hypothetical protein